MQRLLADPDDVQVEPSGDGSKCHVLAVDQSEEGVAVGVGRPAGADSLGVLLVDSESHINESSLAERDKALP